MALTEQSPLTQIAVANEKVAALSQLANMSVESLNILAELSKSSKAEAKLKQHKLTLKVLIG